MLKNNTDQLEMFSDEGRDYQNIRGVPRGQDSVYLNKIREYQKIIFVIIGFIFISIISFSFGVERGKRLMVKFEPQVIGSVKEPFSGQAPLEQAKTQSQIPESAKPALIEKDKLKPKDVKEGSYTIQVASISKSKNVDKLLGSLKNKGYSAFSLKKGEYIVICIGNFGAKKDAQSYRDKLKTSYPDCQIRRL